jgi:hypothetical protein
MSNVSIIQGKTFDPICKSVEDKAAAITRICCHYDGGNNNGEQQQGITFLQTAHNQFPVGIRQHPNRF